jgi:hypothetical protein
VRVYDPHAPLCNRKHLLLVHPGTIRLRSSGSTKVGTSRASTVGGSSKTAKVKSSTSIDAESAESGGGPGASISLGMGGEQGVEAVGQGAAAQQELPKGDAEEGSGRGWFGFMRSGPSSRSDDLHNSQDPASSATPEQQPEDGPWGLEASVPVSLGGSLQEETAEEGDSDSEKELADSLLALGVKHTIMPDGTMEFNFDRWAQSAMHCSASNCAGSYIAHVCGLSGGNSCA